MSCQTHFHDYFRLRKGAHARTPTNQMNNEPVVHGSPRPCTTEQLPVCKGYHDFVKQLFAAADLPGVTTSDSVEFSVLVAQPRHNLAKQGRSKVEVSEAHNIGGKYGSSILTIPEDTDAGRQQLISGQQMHRSTLPKSGSQKANHHVQKSRMKTLRTSRRSQTHGMFKTTTTPNMATCSGSDCSDSDGDDQRSGIRRHGEGQPVLERSRSVQEKSHHQVSKYGKAMESTLDDVPVLESRPTGKKVLRSAEDRGTGKHT